MRWIRLLLAVVVLRAIGLSQPLITIVPTLDPEGVLLIPATDPDVASMVPRPRSEDEEALLRYAVVLRNTTSRAIIANYLRWKLTDSSGRVRPQMLTGKSFPSGSAIPPHSARFLSLESGIGVASGRPGTPRDEVKDVWEQRLQHYHAQRSIEVSIELVVFDDGTAVGPDGAGRFAKFKAWVDAERDFARTALAAGGVVSFGAKVREAREEGFEALPQDAARDNSGLLIAASTATDYSTCHRFVTAYLAAQVAEWIDKIGDDAAIARLRLITSTKYYPVVHRKGE